MAQIEKKIQVPDIDTLPSDKIPPELIKYLKDFNGTRAAIDAGYSEKSARELACRLLKKVNISAAISAGQEKRAKKLEIDADDIANELKLIGFARMGKYAKITERGSVKFTPTDELIASGEDAAIESYSESVTKDGGSSAIKLHNKIKALELLGKHIGMWVDM
jgi:phage terminase small subunit